MRWIVGGALAAPLALSPGGVATAQAPAATVAPAGVSTVLSPVGTIRELQQRLTWVGARPGPVTGTANAATTAAVRNVQGKFGLYVDGIAGPRTWAKLRALTVNRSAIDPRCLTTGQVICVDKSHKVVRAMVAGKVAFILDARFGRAGMETREGVFRVYRKFRQHVSSTYGSDMPFTMSFSGGQAFHYSAGFARDGYAGASHGCVNLRSWRGAERLFDWGPVGVKVVIYHSSPLPPPPALAASVPE